jgi:hypothetical protein
MSSSPRSSSRTLLVAVFFAAVACDLLMGWRSWAAVASGALFDPDSYVRLIRIRDGLAHGGFGYMLPGDAAGAGTEIYWSHLLDLVILLLAAPLRLFLDSAAALHWAGVATGPLSVGLLAASVTWAVRPLAATGWRWTAPLMTVLAPGVIGYGALGVIHYHVPMAAIDVLTVGCAGRAAVGDGRAAALAGLCAAFGIWLSPESVPFALMAFAALVLAWAARPSDARVTVAPARFGLAMLGVTACALATDPPMRGIFAVEFDRISIAYLALAVLIAATGAGLAGLDRIDWRTRRRTLAGLLVSAAAGGAWLALFPAVLSGTGALMSPEQARAFFDSIVEMAPITDVSIMFLYLFAPALAVVFMAFSALRSRSLLRAYAALCALVLVLLGREHVRFAIYAQVMAAMTLPVALTEFGTALARRPPLAAALARVGGFALFLLVPLVPAELGWTADTALARAAAPDSCSLRDAIPLLAPYAGEVVLTSPNDVPELLYRTRVRTVGSLYHRGIAGFMRLRAAWRARPADEVPLEVLASGASYILICPSPHRSVLLAGLPQDTLLDRLDRGDVPSWLGRVDGFDDGTYRLYRIARPTSH